MLRRRRETQSMSRPPSSGEPATADQSRPGFPESGEFPETGKFLERGEFLYEGNFPERATRCYRKRRDFWPSPLKKGSWNISSYQFPQSSKKTALTRTIKDANQLQLLVEGEAEPTDLINGTEFTMGDPVGEQ